MNVHLVIGASGLVGSHLMRALAEDGTKVLGTCRTRSMPGLVGVDICDAENVHDTIAEIRPATIYLPAALTDVDYCESHPEESYRVNVRGVQNVVQAARRTQSRLVYFSTDYIFNGTSGPYLEHDTADPICEYGRHKLYAEHLVAVQAEDYLILRTTVVYGLEPQGKNFVQRLRATLTQNGRIRVPADQMGSPTYAPDLATAAVTLACSDAHGVFHVAGDEIVSRYDFAREAASVFGLDVNLIQAVSTADLQQPARRPLNAGMRSTRLADCTPFRMRGFREGLRAMI